MNEFYHEMEYGFNFWYLWVPFWVVIFGLIGTFKFRLNSNRIATRGRRKYDILLSISALIVDLLTIVLVIGESLLGIMQFFANRLHGYESPKYVFWLTVVVFTIGGFVYYYALTGVANIASWTKLGFLIEKYCKMDEEERKAKQERTREELHQQLRQIHPQQQTSEQEQVVLEPQEYQRIMSRLDQMEAEIRQNFGLPQKIS